ncbi:MAG TPA: SRPBCC domain-containing protein [Caulobacteraceae bacterium]|jgi:hypothetical protein|nr:SRPBCC domain-containing protein [Caulobacteraceae bacterium]
MAYRVQSRVGVAAPASAVWSVIGDLEGWRDWNPLFVEAEGRLSIGALVTLTRSLDGKTERQEVRIVDWVPSAQIVWSRSIAPFARSLAYLEIEPLSERGCILAVGEIYEGRLGEFVARRVRRPLTAAFLALCEAAKARAEATWDGVPDDPVPPPPPAPPPQPKAKTIQMSLRGGGRK